MALLNGLFKSSCFQVFALAGKLSKAGERFFAEHPQAKKLTDCVEKAVDAYMRAMGGLKTDPYAGIDFKPNDLISHNARLRKEETEILCQKIIDAGGRMVVTDFCSEVNLLVFTEDMVLFWSPSLFKEDVYIHPAPYKDKFLSHIHTKGVEYYYYYQSPGGKKVWFGEVFDRPANQLHTAEGYSFSGDRKEDHKLDVALGHFLNKVWK